MFECKAGLWASTIETSDLDTYFVEASVFMTDNKKTIAYHEICNFSIIYESVLFYSADSWGLTHTNIRLGWKGLPGTNTLAYYKNP